MEVQTSHQNKHTAIKPMASFFHFPESNVPQPKSEEESKNGEANVPQPKADEESKNGESNVPQPEAEEEIKNGEETSKLLEDCYEKIYQKHKDIVPILAKERGNFYEHLVNYQGTWLAPATALKGVMVAQQHFKALPTDTILATIPKSGTTWFKALIFATTNRSRFGFSNHPLLSSGPHEKVHFIEIFFQEAHLIPKLSLISSPRLLAVHVPYTLLPYSVLPSGCRIIYVYRNPKDVFVSTWLFAQKIRAKHLPPISLEETFGLFCKGVSDFGPYWDHVLGYWNASLECPEKVLFLTYEDTKRDTLTNVKKMADFLGCPFTQEEEEEGVVQEIIRLCSFENLSNLEVNKTGVQRFNSQMAVQNNNFFRKGKVGDWENHLTPEMIERLDEIEKEKFTESGLMSHVLY